MKPYQFESAIEKLGRVLSTVYNVRVVFQGEQAATDGKVIYLPRLKVLDEKTKKDLNGYLDHEVGHVKFTDFSVTKAIKSRFLFDLINMAEDHRIESKMIEHFPGCYYNLKDLNDSLLAQIDEKYMTYPWPYRLLISLSKMVAGRSLIEDAEIQDYLDYVDEYVDDIRKAKSTKEVKEICEIIYAKIKEKLEEKKEDEKSEGEGEEGEEGEDSKDGKGKEDGGEAHFKEGSMLSEEIGKESKERKEMEAISVHDYMDEKIEKKVEEDKKLPKSEIPEFGRGVSIPATTLYDTVTDHTGKGDAETYHRLRASIMGQINPIKRKLERVLRVKENARWSYERERGVLNPADFSKLRTQPGYRKPFKQQTKIDTRNVAIEILIDLSGSMGGSKIEVAKMTAIALAEALRDLRINFEITGFNSVDDSRVSSASKGLSSGRRSERLDLHVFKDFNSDNCYGLTKIKSGVQNPDGECVAWAAKRLQERKEERKILLVLSDGQPATGDTDGALLRSDLILKLNKINKSGIETVGIGILTDAVKYYYKEHVIVNDLSKLAGEAMAELSKIILKGA